MHNRAENMLIFSQLVKDFAKQLNPLQKYSSFYVIFGKAWKYLFIGQKA